MKKRLSLITSLALILTLLVSIAGLPAPSVLAAPAITQVHPDPATNQIRSGAPNVIAATAASPGSTVASMDFQVDVPALFIAQEIFGQIPLVIFPPIDPGPNNNTLASPAGLPLGSVRAFVIEGVVTAVSGAGEWTISAAGQTFFVYESVATDVRGIGVALPVVGDTVVTVGMRSLVPGPLVADVIRQVTAGGEEADLTTFLFNGTVGATGAAIWTIGGVEFTINDPVFPAVIDPGITVGFPVTVQYAPTPAVTAVPTNIAAEIFLQTPLFILPTIAPAPVFNTRPAPAGLPAGSVLSFDITGVVNAFNPAIGEWDISSQRVKIYESAGTIIRNNGLGGPGEPPGVGDTVRVVGMRTLAAGPLVADVIAQRIAGPEIVDLSFFLFNGTVTATNPATWTIGGVVFVVNDPTFPAVIEPGLGVGFPVTVQYTVAGFPPAPTPALWVPMTFSASTGRWEGVYTPPSAAFNKPGTLFMRATDAAAQVTEFSASITVLTVDALAPAAPSALSAVMGAGINVNVTWTDASTNEASFRLERANDAAFTINKRTFIIATNSTAFTDATAPTGTTVFYRIFAVNGAGETAAAVTASVAVPLFVVPTTVVLAGPANLAVVANLTPTLSWNAAISTLPVTYEVRVSAATDPTFIRPVAQAAGLTVTNFTVPAGALSAASTYRWRVRATNAVGPSTLWSMVFTFRTPLGPMAPRPLTPRPGLMLTNLTPQLTWTDVLGAVSYDVQMSRVPTFATVVVQSTGLGTALFDVPAGSLLGTATYYWRVRVTTATGTSRWSTLGIFRTPTGPRAGPMPLPVAPPSLTPTLSWRNVVLGATSFDVQVSTTPRFTTLLVNQTAVAGTSTTLVAPLSPLTNYYWRVRGVNAFGASPWRIGLFRTPAP